MKISKLLSALVVSATLAGAPLLVSAAPTLRFFDGTTTIDVVDGGAGDVNPAAGAVTFLGGIGQWLTNITTGLSNPILVGPHIDLNSVNVSSITAATGFLDIYLTDTDFTLGAGANIGHFLGLIGGTTKGTVTWEMFVDDGNNPFALTSSIGTDTSAGQVFGDAFSNNVLVNDTFSMTLRVRIIHGNGPGLVTSFDFEGQVVPEPSTLALFGAALLGVAMIRRRRQS